MDDEEEAAPTLRERWSARLGYVIGAVALLAWFAMLWLMFGDVL